MAKAKSTKSKPSTARDLALLFGAPILIVAVAMLLIYIPRLFANPSYDFIYSACDDYSCRSPYRVVDGRITQQTNATRYSMDDTRDQAQLYYYDTSEEKAHSIDYTEAEQYVILKSHTAPDGYKLSQGSRSGGMLFWGGSASNSDQWYLADGAKKKPIELLPTDNAYYDTNFLGWVKK